MKGPKRMSILRNLVVTSAVLSTTVLASETRVNTLQNIDGIQDASDVFTYAGLASHYNLALVELGNASNSDAWAAAVVPVAGGLNLGVAVNRHTWQSGYNNSDGSILMQNRFLYGATTESSSGASDNFLLQGDRSIDLLVSKSLSTGNSLGLRLSTAKEREKVSATSSSTEQLTEALELSVGFSSHGSSNIDVGLTLTVDDNFKYKKQLAALQTQLT